MILHEMERRAHQCLDAICGRMTPIPIITDDYIWREIIDPEFSSVMSDLEEANPEHSYIRSNVRALLGDTYTYTEEYADSFYWLYPEQLWTANHSRNLQIGKPELLRLASLPDSYKTAILNSDSEISETGIFRLSILQSTSTDGFEVRWNDYIDWMIRIAPKSKGCPARNISSQFDETRTMTDYFTDKFINLVGSNIVHSFFAGAAEVSE